MPKPVWTSVAFTVCLTVGAFASDASAVEPEPTVASASESARRRPSASESARRRPSASVVDVKVQPRSFNAEFTQVDNFAQACALMFQSCYYCCLGCGDLGLGLAQANAALTESPVPPPVPRAQAY